MSIMQVVIWKSTVAAIVILIEKKNRKRIRDENIASYLSHRYSLLK